MLFLNLRTLCASGVVYGSLLTLLSGCATTGVAQVAAPTGPPTAAASAPTSVVAVRPPALPGAPPPFAEATRDARRSDGFVPVWTRDDKTWLEIPTALLDQPMFFGDRKSVV